MPIPTTDTRFVLIAPLANATAGATGKLTRLDDYHIALIFDSRPDLDMVFDTTDTEPLVWDAIMPTTQPSMIDPPTLDALTTLAHQMPLSTWIEVYNSAA